MRTPQLPRAALVAALATAAGPLAARSAAAQMVALPVVQAPFPGRPLAVAVDAGGGGDGLRTLGAALAVRRGGSRLAGVLGGGAVQGFAKTRVSFGARVAYMLPIGESGSIGVGPFVGIGVVSRGDSAAQARSTSGRPQLPGTITVIPAGAGLGYRRLVAGRAVALHVTPQAQLWRVGAGGDSTVSTLYGRVAVGADVAVTRQIGLTLAYETGGASEVRGAGAAATGLAQGPRPSLVGVAVSYAPGRGRR